MSGQGAAAGWALPGRVHPAALLIAVLLHVLAIALLLRAGHVAPPPVTVSLSLAMAPSSVVQSSAQPSQALQPVATPPPEVAARPPPPPVTASAPLPPVLSSVSPAAPLAPLPPPVLAPSVPAAPLAPPPPPRPIKAIPPPPALPLPPPLAPPPPPERVTPRPISRPAPVVPHPLPPHPLAPAPAPEAGGRTSALSHPTAGPGAPAPAARSSSWLRAISAWLDAHKFYPELAQQRGEQGTVFVRFTVTRGGQVLEVTVLRGSGSRILDRAAEELLRGATLPPFPASMSGAETTVTFAIRYMLEQ